MKKVLLVMASLMFFTTFAFAGGDQNQNRYDGEKGQGPTQQQRIANPNEVALQAMQLNDEQKATIYSIYEEEKLARDVYITLGNLFPDENTFANIQLSEQKHMDAVKNLCVKYGIQILLEDTVGAFTIVDMQNFYDEVYEKFVTNKNDSIRSALQVGIDIEEMDIEDLKETIAMQGMPRDVIRVLNNLLNGSINHLEAFENAIERVDAQ